MVDFKQTTEYSIISEAIQRSIAIDIESKNSLKYLSTRLRTDRNAQQYIKHLEGQNQKQKDIYEYILQKFAKLYQSNKTLY